VPGSKRYRKPRLFVATLRYSRASFRRVVWKSGQQIWAELHEQAFRHFGGCPQYMVLDNRKEGVLKPDLYEPDLKPVYAATLAHYAAVTDPARVRNPNRKGTVEHTIGHTQATALKGRSFESIEAQNEFLQHWEKNWAAQRIHASSGARCRPCSRRSALTSRRRRCWACSISARRCAPCATTAACGWIGSGNYGPRAWE
jgi:transposase